MPLCWLLRYTPSSQQNIWTRPLKRCSTFSGRQSVLRQCLVGVLSPKQRLSLCVRFLHASSRLFSGRRAIHRPMLYLPRQILQARTWKLSLMAWHLIPTPYRASRIQDFRLPGRKCSLDSQTTDRQLHYMTCLSSNLYMQQVISYTTTCSAAWICKLPLAPIPTLTYLSSMVTLAAIVYGVS